MHKSIKISFGTTTIYKWRETIVDFGYPKSKNYKLIFDDQKQVNQDLLLKLSIKSQNLVNWRLN